MQGLQSIQQISIVHLLCLGEPALHRSDQMTVTWWAYSPAKHSLMTEARKSLSVSLWIYDLPTHTDWCSLVTAWLTSHPTVTAIKKLLSASEVTNVHVMSTLAFSTELLLLACPLLPLIKREHNSKELTRSYISTHKKLCILPLYQYMVCQQCRSYWFFFVCGCCCCYGWVWVFLFVCFGYLFIWLCVHLFWLVFNSAKTHFYFLNGAEHSI